jgi:hypothetical protein
VRNSIGLLATKEEIIEAMVSEEDKRRMRRLAADLAEIENDTVVEGEALRALIRWANDERAKAGIPPLETRELDDIPELGFHERARALGMVRPRRDAPQRRH